MRTVLKITGKRDSQLYFMNEIVFAAIFIIPFFISKMGFWGFGVLG